jgi:hypothetical protein
MLWRQVRPRLLWNVSQLAQVTNSRTLAGHLSGANPVRIPEGVTGAIFHYRPVLLERNATAIRVFGSLRNGSFPPAGGGSEALVFSVLALTSGKLRVPVVNTAAASRKAGAPLPTWLLLEYSTSVIFSGAGECHFVVDVTWLGPPIVGVS